MKAPRVPSSIGPAATRRRSLRTTGALAAVLLTLTAFVVWGDLKTAQAADAEALALSVASEFERAQYNVAVQGLYVRQYRVQPSSAVFRRFHEAADQTVTALRTACRIGGPDARRRADELLVLQRRLGVASDRMMTAVADGNSDVRWLDEFEVAPAYFSLQQRLGATASEYRLHARQRVAALRSLQQRMLIGTVAGFGAGMVLLAMIWRLVLSYQRTLTVHADTNAHLALHDPLTGLPNRTFFAHQLDDVPGGRSPAPAGPDPSSGTPALTAVMILDLDHFKAVNDTLGHHAGDELLVEAGRRLSGVLRQNDVLARLGGDEFAVLLPRVRDRGEALAVAERAAAALNEPFALEASPAPVLVRASIGVAHSPAPIDPEGLVQQADAAMYRAKAHHLGIAVYDQELDLDDPDRLAISGRLRSIVESGDPDGELVLLYQPQVRLSDGDVHGVEALVRWQEPSRGLMLPAQFLPLVQESGLEVPLTYHVLTLAIAEAARWAQDGHPIPVAVNVSPTCLLDPQFVDTVLDTLMGSRLRPSLLRLEVTEGSVMVDPERSRAVLHRLKDTGVLASLDDFGSGFSSLGQLRRLPLGELKIDASFVRELADESADTVLVRTAISLGHHHGALVVAEGVEDERVLGELARLGCDAAQGFLLSPPVPGAALPHACRQAVEVLHRSCGSPPAEARPARQQQPTT